MNKKRVAISPLSASILAALGQLERDMPKHWEIDFHYLSAVLTEFPAKLAAKKILKRIKAKSIEKTL